MPDTWGVIPSLRFADLPAAFHFYTATLGFAVERGTPEEDNLSLSRGDARIMLERASAYYSDAYNKAIRERLGQPSANALYIEAKDLDALEERLSIAGAKIIDPLAPREWGQREFTVEDPEGNWLTFWAALQ